MIEGKECDQPEKLELSPPEEKWMKNDERDERLKRIHTNEIDARNRLRLREEAGGRAGQQRQLVRGKTYE